MQVFSVRVAIHGSSEAWRPVRDALRGAPDVELVIGNGDGERVDVVFYDVDAPGISQAMAALQHRQHVWTIGVGLSERRIVELAGSQYAQTSVNGLAAVIAASGCTIGPADDRAPAPVRR